MSLKRTAVLLAVSHGNHNNSPGNHNSSSHVWNSLAGNANSNPNSNSTDFYTATNFNHTSKGFSNQGMRVMRPGVGGFHGNVNILLGGAMLTVVTTIVCLICYCCHRKIKMRSSASSLYRQQRWLENDVNMEIYSVEQYFDTSGLYTESDNLPTMATINEMPPSYDCVMALDEVISRKRKNLYTFKGFHHHGGYVVKDCLGNLTSVPTTPQVSLDDAHCDIRSPTSAASFCNCPCAINQNFVTSLCANCNNVIDNADSQNNNNAVAMVTTISGSSLSQGICTANETGASTLTAPPPMDRGLSADELNNNDLNGNSCQLDSIASPSTSSNANYAMCSMPSRIFNNNDDDDEEEEEELDGNGNHRQAEKVESSAINTRLGLMRLDMSEITDHTGLPTYEAALHLKSNGYV